MALLVSKIQYKNFEEGEFIGEKERTYDEVISLIETYPWNKEREKILISLTNPSVTVQKPDDSFLKFAVFYNQKFVLHYFNKEKELYSKSFTDFRNSFSFIKSYFEFEDFDISEFKKQNTWMQYNLIHFKSQNFHYLLTPKSLRKYLLSTSAMHLCLSIFLIGMLVVQGTDNTPLGLIIFILLVAFSTGGGINLLAYFNYYLFAKNKILIMSKGNDIFYYGDRDNPIEYNKKNIRMYTTHQITNGRNPLNGFAVIKIEFTDNTEIQIPNILLDEYALQNKLYEYPHKEINGFSFVKWI